MSYSVIVIDGLVYLHVAPVLDPFDRSFGIDAPEIILYILYCTLALNNIWALSSSKEDFGWLNTK